MSLTRDPGVHLTTIEGQEKRQGLFIHSGISVILDRLHITGGTLPFRAVIPGERRWCDVYIY
jgi:hypothetical protein